MPEPMGNARGIRGAIDVPVDDETEIVEATKKLLLEIRDQNAICKEDISAILFTATPDLTAAFPARAARELGWQYVPLMCATEMAVPGSLPRCIRVLVLVNTSKSQKQVKHIYLSGAAQLREDLLDTL